MLITTKLLQAGKYKNAVTPVAATFDTFSDHYTDSFVGEIYKGFTYLATKFDYSGTVLDLGCSTGLFARALFEYRKAHNFPHSTIVGNDISQGMLDKNPNPVAYKEYRVGPLQQVIMDTTEQFDHVVGATCLQYLDQVMMSAVLTRMFFVARKSVTIMVDEVSDAYNDSLKKNGLGHMINYNHIAYLDAFGAPCGWRVACRGRKYGWTSKNTGHDCYTTYFRFEALKPL